MPTPGGSPPGSGPYESLLEIAAGGMATVSVGRRRVGCGADRIVAIKRLRSSLIRDAEKHAGLMDEARIASLINHGNVVSVLDVLEVDGENLLVMEYVDGTALSSLLAAAARGQRLVPRAVVLRIVVDALRGLHAAHEQTDLGGQPLGIVHRDATPQNILVGADGLTRVTDFGIARALGRSVQTEDGRIKGKYRYMAPEQARGAALDRRVDVFAMGVVALEALTGKLLVEGNQLQTVYRLSTGDIPTVASVAPELPAELAGILQESLSTNPEARTRTAEEMAVHLEQWAQAHGEVATASDVARVVEELAGAEIAQRRRRIREVLGGTPERASSPGPAPLARAVQAAGASVTDPRPSAAPLPARRRRLGPSLLGIAAGLFVGVMAIVWLSLRRGGEATPIPISTATTSNSAARTDLVSVRVTSGTPIRTVAAPGIQDVVASADGVSLKLPRSAERLALRVVFADGSEISESIVPDSDLALRTSASTLAPEPTGTAAWVPARGPPPLSTGGSRPPPILKGNPYER
ncbi:MAG: protein kinase [Myxococcales bacterium]|nr:protein kinase [Myxococcales bacterium]